MVAGNGTIEYRQPTRHEGGHTMRSMLLWFLGIPIPIIILIALLT